MTIRSILTDGIFAALLILTPTIAAAQQQSRQVTVAVTDSQPDGRLRLDLPGSAAGRALPVDAATKAQLQTVQSGDIVSVEFDEVDNPQRITRLIQVSRPVDWFTRCVALTISSVAIWLAAYAATSGHVSKLLIGQDDRYSNSKSQLAFWFGAVMVAYLATLMLRVYVWGWDSLGGVGITTNLLTLTGLSALTMGAAKAVTTTKVENAKQEALAKSAAAEEAAAKASVAAVAAQSAPDSISKDAHTAVATAAKQVAQAIAADARAATAAKPPGTPNFPLDLFQNDKKQVDIGDFQMIFIGALAVVIFVLTAFHFLGLIPRGATTLPDVDTTLLSSFGIGQGAYIVKKMASNPGDG
jgi:hypothetical protein